MKVRLHRGHRHHPFVRVAQVLATFVGGDDPGLKQQDRGDDLQAVGDPVLHFLEQDALLAQQLLGLLQQFRLGALADAAGGDVGEGQQDRPVGAGLVEQHAGVEQHGASAQAGKVVLDLEVVHRRMLGKDRLQQDPQCRDIPLTVAKVVEHAATGVFGIDAKGFVERAAGGHHPQVGVEHQQGLVDGVDDGLRQGLGVSDRQERVEHDPRDESDSGQGAVRTYGVHCPRQRYALSPALSLWNLNSSEWAEAKAGPLRTCRRRRGRRC